MGRLKFGFLDFFNLTRSLTKGLSPSKQFKAIECTILKMVSNEVGHRAPARESEPGVRGCIGSGP